MHVLDFLKDGDKYFLPHMSIDIVIIGYEHHRLKCLLLQIGENWLLPGGYVGREESVDTAAQRILKERAGLEGHHLEFLSVFGDKDRSFGDQFREFSNRMGIPWKENYWVNSRFVSLVYYALIDIQKATPQGGPYVESFAWFDFDELPEMGLDHKQIATEARMKLKADPRIGQISHHLLSGPFTMPELHRLHETILDENLDRSRFYKKMLATGLFEQLPKKLIKSPGRNPYQYKVKTHLTSKT